MRATQQAQFIGLNLLQSVFCDFLLGISDREQAADVVGATAALRTDCDETRRYFHGNCLQHLIHYPCMYVRAIVTRSDGLFSMLAFLVKHFL